MNKTNKRKNFLINRPFQLSLIKFALIGCSVIVLIFYLSNLYFISKLKQYGLEASLPENHIYFQFISEQVSLMNMVFTVTAFIAVAFLIVAVTWMSHRIAGPIYRICQELEKKDNSTTAGEIKLRSNDYFPELAVAINKFLLKKH